MGTTIGNPSLSRSVSLQPTSIVFAAVASLGVLLRLGIYYLLGKRAARSWTA
jgi:hypothetical protein